MHLEAAALRFGDRTLWSDVNLDVRPGEFLAILGPNGSGKTSLLRVLLGQLKLSSGDIRIAGKPVTRGNPAVGYIPQQKNLDPNTPLRGRDLVRMGVDGHKWGMGLRGRVIRQQVDSLLDAVGATDYADSPVGLLSGGEQQRLRVAQALASDPQLLLCDEPLLSLDLHHQRVVSALIDQRRREHDTAVLFVTHEVNPILDLVDRVLYLVNGQFRIGTPDEVMNSETLSELYGTTIEVFEAAGRLIIVGADDNHAHHEAAQPRGELI
ncbi:ABC transporter ATP-binding protein [Saxibacter everestensis]|uniref:ABC transporter ATP-binding protein n=1 Tax=Saxibacter everestensis TaxID=2909229 RepID=A0ABY8QYL9_9MICO|nr:ABC transporter ATP-binding protein [Brevibacteriaceae bacterium ZFBP1038]